MDIQLPKVGEAIEVEVEFKNHLYEPHFGSQKSTRVTIKGVMAQTEAYDKNAFRVRTTDPNVPNRVIALSCVTKVNGVAITKRPKYEAPEIKFFEPKTVIVKSSSRKNMEYAVRRDELGNVTCTCPGFGWRKNCQHASDTKFD